MTRFVVETELGWAAADDAGWTGEIYKTEGEARAAIGLPGNYQQLSLLDIQMEESMEQQQPQPSVGRVVHYVSYGTPNGEYASKCRAAVITEVDIDAGVSVVSLAVLNPAGIFFDLDCTYSTEHAGGTWHWPERTDGAA